jgi:hypothetical protein
MLLLGSEEKDRLRNEGDIVSQNGAELIKSLSQNSYCEERTGRPMLFEKYVSRVLGSIPLLLLLRRIFDPMGENATRIATRIATMIYYFEIKLIFYEYIIQYCFCFLSSSIYILIYLCVYSYLRHLPLLVLTFAKAFTITIAEKALEDTDFGNSCLPLCVLFLDIPPFNEIKLL